MENKNLDISKNNKLLAVANIVVFVLVLSVGGILSLFLPKMKVSESEKRELTPMPHFSWEHVFLDNYTDSLDLHYADNFPFRDAWVDFSGMVKETFGYWANDVRIYNTQQDPPSVEKVIRVDSITTVKSDTVINVKKLDISRNAKELVNSILIHGGMAFQLFRGSEDRATAFAEMINKYREALPDSIRIYCLIAPSSIDFYLPRELKSERNLEKPNIEWVYSHLDSGVKSVDAYGEVERHKQEYVYFNTDHHWTGRGAYYAYRAFCERAGLTPAELYTFKRRVRKGYLGSLYDITKDIRLKQNRDSVESFQLPIETVTYRYPASDLLNPVMAPILAGSPNYATFLGGDFPLVRIETENHNARRVLVIKDSFGNAVCPFLAMHFEEVFVVDYRYFERNLLTFIRKNRITEVIFLHNTFVINTEFTFKKEKYLMRIKDPVAVEDESGMEKQGKVEIKGDSTKK